MHHITVTDIVEYTYCPKFSYFQKVMEIPQFEKKRGTVLKGRQVHTEREKRNRGYLPAQFRGGKKFIERTFFSKKLNLVGKADQVILQDGHAVLYERKYSKEFISDTLLVQLGLLAMLITEGTGEVCDKAIVEFIRSNNKQVEIPITPKILQFAKSQFDNFIDTVKNGEMPFSRYSNKCVDCCYKRICPVGSLKRDQ